jgi:hypothetical protein
MKHGGNSANVWRVFFFFFFFSISISVVFLVWFFSSFYFLISLHVPWERLESIRPACRGQLTPGHHIKFPCLLQLMKHWARRDLSF